MLDGLRPGTTNRVAHPILAGLLVVAVLLGVVGVAVDVLTSNGVASGFFVVYGMISGAMGLAGYAALFIGSYVAKYRYHQLFS